MDIRLENVLKYEQPTKYIVKSENYSDDFALPVLTAGKSFVLGYTDETEGVCKASENPVIIFDDFTADCKYVDFDFKVKSSAMKILHKANAEDNLKYYFYAMQAIDYTPFSHKRVWISEYSKFKIENRSVAEQNNIVKDLDTVATAIDNAKQRLNALDELVKSRFIEMFGEIDNNPNNYPIVTIDDVCIKVTDGKHGGCQKQEDSGYYYIGAREIFDGEIHYNTAPQITYADFAKDYKRCNIETGDLVIVNTGATIGKSAIAKSPLTDHTLLQKSVALYKVKKDVIDVLFLQYCYMTHPSLYLVEGAAAQPNLLISTIKKTKIYLPPIELQNEFADFVKLTDKSKFIVQKQIEDLQELLDSKMDEYFG